MGTTRGGKTDPEKWVWDFNDQSIIGIKISNLPIEEFLFPLVGIPLPIDLWEYVKNIDFQTETVVGILAFSIFTVFIIFPWLARPDKTQ